MAETKFYKCNHCGNVVTALVDAGVTPACCGEPMTLLVAGSTDAAVEKHVPAITRDADGRHYDITVGSVPHPMTEEHLIQFIIAEVGAKTYQIKLTAADEPKLRFSVRDNSQPITVYEYCNLHGLWKAEA
jgi:superoxide reductase